MSLEDDDDQDKVAGGGGGAVDGLPELMEPLEDLVRGFSLNEKLSNCFYVLNYSGFFNDTIEAA